MFDMKYVPTKYIPYAGLLKAVLGMIGTENYSYGELFNEINMYTGGISEGIQIYRNHADEDFYGVLLSIRAKALYDKIPFTFAMIEEIILRTCFEDTKRLYEIISEQKSGLSERLTSAGHMTAVVRAAAYSSEISAYNDLIGGIEYYKMIEHLADHFEEEKENLVTIFKELMGYIFRKDNMLVSVTCDRAGYEPVVPLTLALREKLAEGTLPVIKEKLALGQKNEGFMTSSQVQYVARTGNYRNKGYEYTGALKILKLILSYEYLWVNIRVKGGAYGCMSAFGSMGESYFVSYRDPNLSATNEVYEGIVDYVKNFEADDRDMTKYVIGTISELDTPLNPKGKGIRSLNAWLSGVTKEEVQKERDEILYAKVEDIQALAPYIQAILADNNFCVIGGEERIKKESSLFIERKPLIGDETNE